LDEKVAEVKRLHAERRQTDNKIDITQKLIKTVRSTIELAKQNKLEVPNGDLANLDLEALKEEALTAKNTKEASIESIQANINRLEKSSDRIPSLINQLQAALNILNPNQ